VISPLRRSSSCPDCKGYGHRHEPRKPSEQVAVQALRSAAHCRACSQQGDEGQYLQRQAVFSPIGPIPLPFVRSHAYLITEVSTQVAKPTAPVMTTP